MHELPGPLDHVLRHVCHDLLAGLGLVLLVLAVGVLGAVVVGAGGVLEEGLGVAAVAVAARALRSAQLVAVVLVLRGLEEDTESVMDLVWRMRCLDVEVVSKSEGLREGIYLCIFPTS